MHQRAAIIAALALALTGGASGQVFRDDFSKGTDTPAGWTLREGEGSWDGARGSERSVSVRGNGEDMSYWARTVDGLRPNAQYMLRFRSKAMPGSSPYTIIAGLDACNRDFPSSPDWTNTAFVFTTPSEISGLFLRLGQWHLKGTVQFSHVTLMPVQPIYRSVHGISLGEGESIVDRFYEFRAPLSGAGSNSSRCLVSHTAPFNSNRWVFTGGSEVIYRHEVPGVRQNRGTIRLSVNYHTGGRLRVEVSGDGRTWTAVGTAAEVGPKTFPVPTSLLPIPALYVRLRGEATTDAAGNSAPGAFQIDRYEYRASLDGEAPDVQGSTAYVQLEQQTPGVRVDLVDVGDLSSRAVGNVKLRIETDARDIGELGAVLALTLARPEDKARTGAGRVDEYGAAGTVSPGKPLTLTIPYRTRGSGDLHARLSLRRAADDSVIYAAALDTHLPDYYAEDYGYSLTPTPGGDLWWCEGVYKVPPHRLPPPQEHAATAAEVRNRRGAGAITIETARREREHVQLVFRPADPVGPIHVGAARLTGPGGKTLPPDAVQIRQVAYVPVREPTDRTGVADEWPDPLPPLANPWQPAAGRNNVLWITVTAPADAAPGIYAGGITLRTSSWTRTIALRVRVRSFALPARTSLRSGFGIQSGAIARYHNLKSPEDMEKVWDLYMEAFRSRRMAPYNPMSLAPYRIQILGRHWNGGARDSERPATGSASLKVVDADPARDVNAVTAEMIRIRPGARYRLSWRCRTERAGQPYLVTITHYDAGRGWMPMRNNDMARTGTGEWQAETADITDRIPPDTAFVTVTVRPTLWTEKGEGVGTAWFDDIELREIGAENGPNLIAGGDFEAGNDLGVDLDFTAFDKAARRYLDDMGFNAFTIAVEGLPYGRYPDVHQGSFGGFAADTTEYDQLMRAYGRNLEEHLEENGWLSKAYVYWYDEPETGDYPLVRDGAARLKRYFPRLKRMMTEQFEQPLFGSVDLWCPITPAFEESPSRARQKLGEEVWWYVCTGPKEPYCTLFIDHPAIELRLWLWQTWQRGIQGILIWDTTWWTSPQQFPPDRVQNPWKDPMAYVAAESGVWGNGDGRFFYPPNQNPNGDRTTPYLSGPVISQRWEMLGDGIEDWEYLTLLKRLLAEAPKGRVAPGRIASARKLLDVPANISRSLTDFNRDPKPLLRRRKAIGDAIDQLQAAIASRRGARR